MRVRPFAPALALVVALVLGLSGCTRSLAAEPPGPGGDGTASAVPQPTPSDAFVRTDGRRFTVGGHPFRFVGVNIYDAAATDRYSCRPASRMSAAQLSATLQTLHREAGATVLRFWAYQTYTQGATDWSGIDQVLAAAKAAGMRVIPVLEDGPGDCTTISPPAPKSSYEGDTWYTTGYRAPYGNATLSYRDYVRAVVQHYADDPTILGWSMMNEAETNTRTGTQSALVPFARDVAGVIRAADPHHLITLGTQSNGAPGASGPDFRAIYDLPGLSFAEVHDWAYWGSDTEPMPGGQGAAPPSAGAPACAARNAPVGCSFAMAAKLGKPLVVGEAGMRGTTAHERTLRAERLRAKMDAAFGAGASGYLVWSVTTTDTDGYDVVLGRHDPLLGQLHDVAAGL